MAKRVPSLLKSNDAIPVGNLQNMEMYCPYDVPNNARDFLFVLSIPQRHCSVTSARRKRSTTGVKSNGIDGVNNFDAIFFLSVTLKESSILQKCFLLEKRISLIPNERQSNR